MRRNTPADDSAWIVHIEPDRPWLMALSIGSTSSPRTSPTMTRSAFMRSDRRTRSATGIRPSPSMLAGRASSATMSGWRVEPVSRPSSKACSIVTIRSRRSISAASARSRVVFPEFIAPDTTMFFRARTAAASSERRPVVHGPHGAELVERQVGEPVPADGHRRTGRHGHERGQPGAAGQLQVELRPGRVEAPLGQPEPAGGGAERGRPAPRRSRPPRAIRPLGCRPRTSPRPGRSR